MKLIVDVPDYNLNDVRNGSIACGQILKAVRNGKPYEEGRPGDCISREALKKDIEENSIILEGVRAIEVDCAKVLIDNAPIVEIATELQPNCNNLQQTQGEWEDYSVDFYRCPECGYLLNKDCPHCQNKVILPKGGAE